LIRCSSPKNTSRGPIHVCLSRFFLGIRQPAWLSQGSRLTREGGAPQSFHPPPNGILHQRGSFLPSLCPLRLASLWGFAPVVAALWRQPQVMSQHTCSQLGFYPLRLQHPGLSPACLLCRV
jgi:hypothetical protein